jgi:8-oxo-dGTP pyrophosphatase MutT (NUDIX family)
VVEYSFGIIPMRRSAAGVWEILLIQHRYSLHWSFPKGHAELGEDPFQTACRELSEETGLSFVKLLNPYPLVEHYHFVSRGIPISKTVSYFLALVEGQITLQEREVVACKWVPLLDAPAHLTFPQAKRISLEAYSLLKDQ